MVTVKEEIIREVAWAILQALHADVPQDKRPLAWCDLSEEQEQRILRSAQLAVNEAVQQEPKELQPLKGCGTPTCPYCLHFELTCPATDAFVFRWICESCGREFFVEMNYSYDCLPMEQESK